MTDRAANPAALDRSRRLLKPTRFDPPALTPLVTTQDIADRHADQLAAAMAVAREEGLRQARAEVDAAIAGHDQARRELLAAAEALRRAAAQLLDRDGESVEALQEQCVMFGVSLAEELLGRELDSCDEAVLAAVERALALVPDRGEIVLRLHATDLHTVQRYVDDLAIFGDRITIAHDVAVERGGCVAVVGPMRVDAQLGPALERVRATLRS